MSLPRPRADAHPAVDFRWRARAKEFAPRKKALLGESLPTRRTGERICPREKALLRESIPTRRTSEGICPAQEHAPRRRPPDTARRRKDLPRARTLPTAKASRHGAKAKEFVPTREHAPRRRPPDTAHERKNLPRAETRSSAKASRHGARAKEFAPRGSPSPHVPTNGGPPSTDGQPKNTPSAGSHPRGRGRCRVHSPKKNKTTP